MKWKKVKIRDIAICVQRGTDLDAEWFESQFHNSNYAGSGTPVIMPKDIVDGQIRYADLRCVSNFHATRLNRHQVFCGNLIIARKGDVRKCVCIGESENGWLTGADCLKVVLDEKKCIPLFIYYQIRSPFVGKLLETVAIGSTMPSLNSNILRDVDLCCPPLSTQRRIASILSAYDELIETNRRQIKLLEEAAQRLYKEWFVDLRFPGWENAEFVDGAPKGWRIKSFSEVFDYVRGKSYKSSELSAEHGVLMANLKSIRPFGGYKRNEEKRFTGEYKDNQTLKPGDIIMGVTDMTKERRLVGHVALTPTSREPMIFSMDLIKLVPKTLPNSFLYSAMFFGKMSLQVSALANGTNVLHLKPESMMNIKMLVPDSATLREYDRFFSSIHSKIETLQDQTALAQEARDRLLPKLMSGEIEV